MPILKPEADLHPPDLFDLPVETFPWWVAHIRSRLEKTALREARLRGIPSFLPQYEKAVRREGRTITSFLPLFPGYLFVRGGLDERAEILRTNLCVRVLEVQDQAALDRDLQQIRRLQLSGVPIVSHPDLKPGDVVRMAEGPFRGIEGVIVKTRGKTRLVVAVRFIQRSVSVEVPRESVVIERAKRGRPPSDASARR
jgi:transcriptional antiterminator RfaH